MYEDQEELTIGRIEEFLAVMNTGEEVSQVPESTGSWWLRPSVPCESPLA